MTSQDCFTGDSIERLILLLRTIMLRNGEKNVDILNRIINKWTDCGGGFGCLSDLRQTSTLIE